MCCQWRNSSEYTTRGEKQRLRRVRQETIFVLSYLVHPMSSRISEAGSPSRLRCANRRDWTEMLQSLVLALEQKSGIRPLGMHTSSTRNRLSPRPTRKSFLDCSNAYDCLANNSMTTSSLISDLYPNSWPAFPWARCTDRDLK